jgi:uncharacterized membrane protein (DUF106 family)
MALIKFIKVHPAIYGITVAMLFVGLIIVINFYTITVSGQNQLKNQLKDLQSQIQEIENKAQKETKDLNRFQSKKFGIEAITPADLIAP